MSPGEPITAAGLAALDAELAELEGPVRAQLAKKIKAARAEGDLSENAEYKALKEEQAHLETKILRLNERRRNAVVVEADADSSVVGFGSTVRVTDLAGGTPSLASHSVANRRAGTCAAFAPANSPLLYGIC